MVKNLLNVFWILKKPEPFKSNIGEKEVKGQGEIKKNAISFKKNNFPKKISDEDISNYLKDSSPTKMFKMFKLNNEKWGRKRSWKHGM